MKTSRLDNSQPPARKKEAETAGNRISFGRVGACASSADRTGSCRLDEGGDPAVQVLHPAAAWTGSSRAAATLNEEVFFDAEISSCAQFIPSCAADRGAGGWLCPARRIPHAVARARERLYGAHGVAHVCLCRADTLRALASASCRSRSTGRSRGRGGLRISSA